jgi:hypothetical protein
VSDTIYVDTGFWIALLDARDEKHQDAVSAFSRLFDQSLIVTSELVIGETITYLNCSLKRHDRAVTFLDQLNAAPLQILFGNAATRSQASEIIRKYVDLRLSYADCVSFTLMRERSINLYAGFDKHFSIMGFQPVCNL